MILKKLVLGPFGSNCYIVGSEVTGEGLIVDPGGDPNTILEAVNELGLAIKTIVITHNHIDHIAALKEVKEATGAEVAIHGDDAGVLKAGKPLRSMFGGTASPPPPPDRLLKDRDNIDVGDLHFVVAHTPGHSPGGICLVGEGVVFTGDTLFNFGIGRYDTPGGNGGKLMNSIHTRLMVLPDDTAVYPGHGSDSTIGNERRINPFLTDQTVL